MGVSTYAELKQSIIDWTKRNDTLGKLDDFIDLAESDIWRQLKCREMEYRTTLSTSTSSRFVALPTGYLSMRQLQITVDDVLHDLPFVPLKAMAIKDSAGTPYEFTVTSQIELNRVSDQVYTLEIDCFRSLTALSDAAPTNDVLTNYPMIYLAACLSHAYLWALKPQEAAQWEMKFKQAVAAANKSSRRGRFGPAPAGRKLYGMVV